MSIRAKLFARTAVKSVRRSLRANTPVWIAYGLLVLLFIVTTIVSPAFAAIGPVGTLAAQASFLGIVALGQTFVIISGGVDLSVSAVISAAAVLSSSVSHGHNSSLVWVVPLCFAVGLVVGTVNGIGVAIGVSPIIMTLGTQGVVYGSLLLYTKGQAGYAPPQDLIWLGTHKWGPVPVVVVLWIVLGVVGGFALRRTIYGRHLYAIGTEPTVANFSGVNLPLVRVVSYVISALCAVVAGLAVGGYVAQTYLTIGDTFLFTSVAAVVVGGASILGGSGLYIGTVAGAAILTLLTNLLDILNLKAGALEMIYGGVILATVAVVTRRTASSVVR
ncbi:MAG: ABC transporter permease [Candidatus Rokuibacteriota bacterium]|nr:MAG: ABC transporter permease [Candidatus Rokubacteria bacterium]